MQDSSQESTEPSEYCLACHKHALASITGPSDIIRLRSDSCKAYGAMVSILKRNKTAKAKTAEEVQDEQKELDIAGSYTEGTCVNPKQEARDMSTIACVPNDNCR